MALPAVSYTSGMRSIGCVIALAGAGLGLAACGGSGSTPAGVNTAAGKFSHAVQFAHCMRSHGVTNFPDPGSNGRGGLEIQQRAGSGSGPALSVNGVAVSSPVFQSAMHSCRSYLPNGGHPPPLSAARRAQMLRFSQCMRTHGITNFPDPTFGSGGGVGLQFGPSSGINPRSPAFQRAQSACASVGGGFGVKVPDAGPTSGAGASTGG